MAEPRQKTVLLPTLFVIGLATCVAAILVHSGVGADWALLIAGAILMLASVR